MKWWNPFTWWKNKAEEESLLPEAEGEPSPLLPPPPPQVVEFLEPEPPPPPPPPPVIFVRIRLYGPFLGLYKNEPMAPYLEITGVDLEEAAHRLHGGARLDWNTVPKAWLEVLETGSQKLALPWAQVKAFLQEG